VVSLSQFSAVVPILDYNGIGCGFISSEVHFM
jgi:hypothetical protein